MCEILAMNMIGPFIFNVGLITLINKKLRGTRKWFPLFFLKKNVLRILILRLTFPEILTIG